MSPLLPALDLRIPLATTAQIGASFIREAIDGPGLPPLQDEIAGGSFRPLPRRVGPYGVRQEAELLEIPAEDLSAYPAVAQLQSDLAELIHTRGSGISGLAAWQPSDIAAMRYQRGSLGITPHRDGKRYRYLIAIFTIEGSAPFTLCADREGTTIDRWLTVPGSLVLMRAPGLGGVEDGRPYHTVGGSVTSTRVSLAFRMRVVQ